MALSVIILAAGKGTRMGGTQPKVMYKIASQPMIGHIFSLLKEVGAKEIVTVIGRDMDDLREYVSLECPISVCVVQEQVLGTAAAVGVGLEGIKESHNDILILYGDTPFVTHQTIHEMHALLKKDKKNALVLLGFAPNDTKEYGRLVVENDRLLSIIEHIDCSEAEREIDLCNAGVMLVKGDALRHLLPKVTNKNKKKEFYLTDLVEIANANGYISCFVLADEFEATSINSQHELAQAEATFQDYLRDDFLKKGISMVDPGSVYFAFDTVVETGVTIYPNVFIGKGVRIKTGSVIHSFSHIDGATIGPNANVGPFARIRAGTHIEVGAKVGSFVETKNSIIGKNSKVNHLAYIGDTQMGENVNIGAGTITCNYDGFVKSRTVIGDHALVGANVALVAPVVVGARSIIGAGSVITKDIPDGDLAISRPEQKNLAGKGGEYREQKESVKKLAL